MKAISAVIATIMLLMISVSLIGVFYVFSSTMAGTTTSSGEEQASQLTSQLSSCMLIENINWNQVSLKNCGKGIIDNKSLVVTMDDTKLGASVGTINEGGSGTVNISGLINVSIGKHNLKIYSGGAVAQALVDVSKYGIGTYPDFSGWSDQRTYDCAGYKMMGGYNNFGVGASTQKTFDLPAGNYIIEFNYYFGDSWDAGEVGRAFWNGNQIWSLARPGGVTVNICGAAFIEKIDNAVYGAVVNHPGGPATIRFDSTLNSVATDEWFGVNNVTITGGMKQII